MSNVEAGLKYSKEHEWVKVDGNIATCGITDYAQEQLGDVVFIEAPEVGTEVESGAAVSTIESVKAVSDIYAPLAGKVTEVNDALKDNPALVNSSAYNEGWLFKIEIADESSLDSLISDSEYEEFLKTL